MAITYNKEAAVFSLATKKSEYQIKIGRYGFLLHSYYGAPVGGEDMSYLIGYTDCGFSGNPAEAKGDRTFSVDTLPLEYPVYGIGDFRDACLQLCLDDGSRSADFRYKTHIIYDGKYSLDGLPAMYGGADDWQTLEITMQEIACDISLTLYYAVSEKYNIITRACAIKNASGSDVKVERLLSYCVDFPRDDFDLMTFCGRHAFERAPERAPLRHGFQGAQSIRGASSHQYNPFGILCAHNADEQCGECYGFQLLYSGNFLLEAERTHRSNTRIVGGIHPQGFTFLLKNGDSLTAPEAALTYSPNGFGEMSHNYHDAFRTQLCRTPAKWQSRPVVLNNWEATYFDFDEEKLIDLAQSAEDLGIDMLVLDDGWFGSRNSDLAGLGDWVVNAKKLPHGLPSLVEKINAMGLKFGIWVEPEMVNEDSELYRAHPDWAFKAPNREPCHARDQLVLDFSRREVRDYIYNAISAVLKSANIEYLKWDMNRHLANVFSASLTAERQGEAAHRYVLGVYEFMERLHIDFPDLLIEGCSGGGGRFDAGMLYYTPQIWCSDNTDPIERLTIQYGTSFGYPASSVSAHVSASPNHQTGRSTPFNTRATAAMTGCFGFELNPAILSDEEKAQLRAQIKLYKAHEKLMTQGLYSRLTTCDDKSDLVSWQFTSHDKSEALVNVVAKATHGNAPFTVLLLAELDESASYIDEESRIYKGAALCRGGILIPQLKGDYPAFSMYFKKVEGEL